MGQDAQAPLARTLLHLLGLGAGGMERQGWAVVETGGGSALVRFEEERSVCGIIGHVDRVCSKRKEGETLL